MEPNPYLIQNPNFGTRPPAWYQPVAIKAAPRGTPARQAFEAEVAAANPNVSIPWDQAPPKIAALDRSDYEGPTQP